MRSQTSFFSVTSFTLLDLFPCFLVQLIPDPKAQRVALHGALVKIQEVAWPFIFSYFSCLFGLHTINRLPNFWVFSSAFRKLAAFNINDNNFASEVSILYFILHRTPVFLQDIFGLSLDGAHQNGWRGFFLRCWEGFNIIMYVEIRFERFIDVRVRTWGTAVLLDDGLTFFSNFFDGPRRKGFLHL